MNFMCSLVDLSFAHTIVYEQSWMSMCFPHYSLYSRHFATLSSVAL